MNADLEEGQNYGEVLELDRISRIKSDFNTMSFNKKQQLIQEMGQEPEPDFQSV
jgi:hypothetical protein